MKHLKKFNEISEYDTFKNSSDYILPNVSYIVEDNSVCFENETKKEQYNRVFDVDLLILDDLGTENLSNTKFTELFNIINTRLLKDKKTIISTNLTLQDLAVQYDDRVMSRLIGNYTICRFFGEDIRLKKKRMC